MNEIKLPMLTRSHAASSKRSSRLISSGSRKEDRMPKKHKHHQAETGEREAEGSRLTKLRKVWAKASDEERAAFLRDLSVEESSPLQSEEMLLVANGRYLLQSTITRVERIMVRRNIRPAEIASEIGFSGEGPALARALITGASLRLSLVRALAAWLAEQESTLEH